MPFTPAAGRIAGVVVNSTLAGRPFAAACRASAGRAGWRARVYPTGKPHEAADLARAALRDGARLVVAAGGDGTVRGCAQALVRTGVPLAIVPLGTANLVAVALGLPHRPERALDVAFDGADALIDLALADGEPFAAMAGIGLDAAVVAATSGKHRLGWLAYAMAGVTRLRLPPTAFTVRIDDGERVTHQARCVVVGNVGLLPGGFALLPDARPDDGLLDVGILAPSGPLGWTRVAGRVLARGRHDDEQLYRRQASRVEIVAAVPLPREADGELMAESRTLTVAVAPRSLLVRVPAPRGRTAGRTAGRTTGRTKAS